MTGEWVVVGRIGRPHGLAGVVRAEATGPTLPAIPVGTPLRLNGPEDAPARERVLAGLAGTPPRLLLTFAGVGSREEAAALTGAVVEVPTDRLPALGEPDTVYVRDLIGCAVESGGRPLGHVVDVLSAPANDVLVVDGPDGQVLVPFTGDALPHADVAGRRLVVRDGLLPG